MNFIDRRVVTSAEFARNFGQLRQALGSSPIFVTHHGRETHVLLTTKRYEDLIDSSHRAGRAQGDAIPPLEDVADWMRSAVVIVDVDKAILFSNSVAHAMLGREGTHLSGHEIYHAIPELEGSLAQGYINRAVAAREPSSADLPSMFRENGWMRLQVIPTAHSTVILIRDITEDVSNHRLADAKKAIVHAMSEHGGIGYIRTNTRGHIETIDASMCNMLMLPEKRLSGAAVAELIPRPRRAAFREVLNKVLDGEKSAQVETNFLANDGSEISVCGAIVELRGAYGAEGAVLIFTRADPKQQC